jgi:hypothetical protein
MPGRRPPCRARCRARAAPARRPVRAGSDRDGHDR